MDSVLNSIKKMIGLDEENTHFDTDVMIHINSVFADLKQIGVGPAEGFRITGTFETWSDFTSDKIDIESVKTYMYLRVRLLFDPPTTSALVEAMTKQADKLEWRLNVAAETI